jgi:hypothetical protein
MRVRPASNMAEHDLKRLKFIEHVKPKKKSVKVKRLAVILLKMYEIFNPCFLTFEGEQLSAEARIRQIQRISSPGDKTLPK